MWTVRLNKPNRFFMEEMIEARSFKTVQQPDFIYGPTAENEKVLP